MMLRCALCLAVTSPILWGQTPTAPISQTTPDTSTLKLVFSEPKLDSPVEMPSAAMGGPPLCGPEGESFIKFLTPPPYYNHTTVYSISPDGKSVHYQTEQIIGLKDIQLLFTDPGVTNAVFLLRATSAGESAHSPANFYLTLFDYDGKLQHSTKLDLGFDPVELVQLSVNSFFVSGVDSGSGGPRFAVIDDSGTIRRNLSEATIMPSDQEMTAMVSSIDIVGINPNEMPPSLKVGALLSLFRPVHSAAGVLILEPGAGAHVIEVLKSGETRTVKLNLPPKQVAQSIVTRKGSWFVRTSSQDSETVSNLFQVDTETGETIKRFDTSGVPATSIACSVDSGFYGFRWIDHKPYLISAELK